MAFTIAALSEKFFLFEDHMEMQHIKSKGDL